MHTQAKVVVISKVTRANQDEENWPICVCALTSEFPDVIVGHFKDVTRRSHRSNDALNVTFRTMLTESASIGIKMIKQPRLEPNFEVHLFVRNRLHHQAYH